MGCRREKMIENFEAFVCAVQEMEDADTFLITLADRADFPTHYIELQRSIGDYDEQDIDLGMDTYCIVTDSGATSYGGVVSCTMTDDSLDLEFSKEAEAKLGVKGYKIILALSTADKALLRSGLRRLFNDEKHTPQYLSL
jgi:hypothetical protein